MNEQVVQRFWSKIDVRTPLECWPWLGTVFRGKGVFPIGKTSISPRRFMWELEHGQAPPRRRDVEVRCGDALCMNPAHHECLTMEEKFWRKVDKTPTCWLWTSLLQHRGYGIFFVSGFGYIQAHRYSWEMASGPIPEGLFVCHTCDVPKCVRPGHLFLGTPKDNMDDMWKKGRSGPQKARAAGLKWVPNKTPQPPETDTKGAARE